MERVDNKSISQTAPVISRVKEIPPHVKVLATKVNNWVLGALLLLGIFPGVLYYLWIKNEIAIENSDPFEKLDRSLRGTMEAKFVVGSNHEPMKKPLIANAITRLEQDSIVGSDGKEIKVVHEIGPQIQSGFDQYQFVGVDGKAFLENGESQVELEEQLKGKSPAEKLGILAVLAFRCAEQERRDNIKNLNPPKPMSDKVIEELSA